jgi:hypothetical protein
LVLDGLTSLEEDVAKKLKFHRHRLSLNGLKEISDGAVEHLAGHRGESLSLDGLVELSAKASRALSAYRGEVSLKGLKEPLKKSRGKTAKASRGSSRNRLPGKRDGAG